MNKNYTKLFNFSVYRVLKFEISFLVLLAKAIFTLLKKQQTKPTRQKKPNNENLLIVVFLKIKYECSFFTTFDYGNVYWEASIFHYFLFSYCPDFKCKSCGHDGISYVLPDIKIVYIVSLFLFRTFTFLLVYLNIPI